MLKTDFEIWFRDFQVQTGKKFDKQSGIFWNMMRWEKYGYSCEIIPEVANQIVSQFEKKHDDRKNLRNIIGYELRNKRKLKIVTSELMDEKAFNMQKINENGDIKQGDRIEFIRFPLVYRRCSCGWFLGNWDGGLMNCMPTEGVWWCSKCDGRSYDEFYNHEWLKKRDGIKAPEIKDINKIELPV